MTIVLCLWLSTVLPNSAQAENNQGARSVESPLPTIPWSPDTFHSIANITEEPQQLENQSPIEISSKYGFRIDETATLHRSHCVIRQGETVWAAPSMVIWQLSPPNSPSQQLLAYLESTPVESATVSNAQHTERKHFFLVDLSTTNGVKFTTSLTDMPEAAEDQVYKSALEQRKRSRGELKQTQYVAQPPGFLPPPPLIAQPQVPSIRRHVTIGPRFLGGQIEFKVEQSEGTVPAEYIITVSGGVNIVVNNVPLKVDGRTILTRIDLTADRAVVWTSAERAQQIGSFDIDENTPFQVYLEGNIVVRQGSNVVRASHAYYDINQRRGLMMNAEVRSKIPELDGTIRLRASEIRQLSDTTYHARNAWFTTSEFGQPKWRLQASDIVLEERFFPNGPVNPNTGQPPSMTWVTSNNNWLYLENAPVLPLPYLTGPVEDPNIPIRKLAAGYSGMFGAELETSWNLEGIFGMQLPRGTDLELDANYYSERGPSLGLRTEYDFYGALMGLPGHHRGYGHATYQYDTGRDNLGLGRRNLVPADENRGRALWRNRSEIAPNTWINAEIGHVFNNDRNFMEQWYENEWDTQKDLENLISINHQIDNVFLSLLASANTNEFENQTNWLPKADVTILGEPILNGPLVYSSHSSVGYGDVNPADPPVNDTIDPFDPLPYYQDAQGVVAMTRHELSLPFNVGPVNIVPYVMGEAAYWQEDYTQNDLARLYGTFGVRSSVQFSKYMPQVRSAILGLNGLAHKVNFDLDYYYADSSQPLSSVPQYNELNDNPQERFLERLIQIEHGGTLPAMFNPRNYAVRTGAGRSVSSPYHELVDDQHVMWLGMRNRWQTKVGPLDRPRVVNWMELDLGAAWFPEASRDNFGESFGLFTGRYAWHVGPRTSVLANGIFDIFNDGQRVWNVGLLSQRPGRGSFYVGYREVDAGPIASQLLTGSFSYVLSPNLYVATFGTSFDIAEGIDRGQSLTLTRIGEYYLLHFGLGYDRSRDNVGVAVSFEPKFGNYGGGSTQLSSLLGIQ